MTDGRVEMQQHGVDRVGDRRAVARAREQQRDGIRRRVVRDDERAGIPRP